MKKITSKHGCVIAITLVFAIAICTFVGVSIQRNEERQAVFLEHERIRQEYIAQGIYEIDLTYVGVRSQTMVFYMVCEPSDNAKDLENKIDAYLTEELLSELRTRSKKFVTELGGDNPEESVLDNMWLVFLEPYEELDIGVFPEPGTILDFDYNPEGHSLAIISASMTEGDNSYSTYINEERLKTQKP